MATISQADITVTPTWVNIAAGNTALAAASCLLQNICPGDTIIRVAGAATGATAPTGTGIGLSPKESILVNSGTLWVRAESSKANCKLAVTLV